MHKDNTHIKLLKRNSIWDVNKLHEEGFRIAVAVSEPISSCSAGAPLNYGADAKTSSIFVPDIAILLTLITRAAWGTSIMHSAVQ
jgi:hypothetical protein